MEKQKNQDIPSLLDGIQSEVSAENAPLLQFITAHASKIAGVVLLLLLALGGTAVWKWYHGNKQAEAHAELVQITSQLQGADKDAALSRLAQEAPESTRLFILLSLAQSAVEHNNPVLAGEAYAQASKLAGDSALGLTAALGSAGSLLMQAQFPQALALLQELAAKWPDAARSPQFQQMLAEAAQKAGNISLALKTYEELAGDISTPQAAYFRNRVNVLKEALKQSEK